MFVISLQVVFKISCFLGLPVFYFKLWGIDLIEIIVWNINGLSGWKNKLSRVLSSSQTYLETSWSPIISLGRFKKRKTRTKMQQIRAKPKSFARLDTNTLTFHLKGVFNSIYIVLMHSPKHLNSLKNIFLLLSPSTFNAFSKKSKFNFKIKNIFALYNYSKYVYI